MDNKMWPVLPKDNKDEYKKIILAFASLTEMFTQKAIEDNEIPAPIINSKFQETIFQKAFNAYAEDIGNTSYDVSLKLNVDGKILKYLIGIKTFGIASGDQKIAQFKAYQPKFSRYIERIEKNSLKPDLSKEEMDELNNNDYMQIAKTVSKIRNDRIDSSIENLKGFKISNEDNVSSVYHVLMPSKKGDKPQIFVGETNYDKINIENISILGCTNKKNPTNFVFTDGNHNYKYTSSDSQLYMRFNNNSIVVDTWNVIYANDAYSIFSNIAKEVYESTNIIGDKIEEKEVESYSWSLIGRNGNVELFSGLNSFYSVGSKLSKDSREKRCKIVYEKHKDEVDVIKMDKIYEGLKDFLLTPAPTSKDKLDKIKMRSDLNIIINETENEELINDVRKIIYRPLNEVYIPIPNSKKFHTEHPNFFGENIGKINIDEETGKEIFSLSSDKEDESFNLIFEPSGDSITSYITQDNGKAIESYEKQSYLGEWILRKVFQLKEYEPLTVDKLNEIGINGIRLYKEKGSNDIHLKFIWIDEDNLPSDYYD